MLKSGHYASKNTQKPIRILSNAFLANMPGADHVPQGGPANFARLFANYLVSNTNHEWIGLIDGNPGSSLECHKKYSFRQRNYYDLNIPEETSKKITHATEYSDPAEILDEAIKRVTDLIHKEKIDVIFLNGFYIHNWIMLRAGQKTSIPVVIQHAGIWTKELRLYAERFSKHGRLIMEKMEQDASEKSTHQIFLNEWSKTYFDSNVCSLNADKTSVIPLPFDFVSFIKTSAENVNLFDFDKKRTHFGIIARWDKIKNHSAILDLATETKKQSLPWDFHSVVDIPQKNDDKIDAKQYSEVVNVVPPLDRSGICQFCNAVDILILPSIFDVSPTVVLEAFSTNTPIIISPNIGFAHEFKAHGGQDWVVDFSDKTNAVQRIKNLVGRKMPSALIKSIKKNHQSEKVFEQYIEVFKSVAEKKQEESNELQAFPMLLENFVQ